MCASHGRRILPFIGPYGALHLPKGLHPLLRQPVAFGGTHTLVARIGVNRFGFHQHPQWLIAAFFDGATVSVGVKAAGTRRRFVVEDGEVMAIPPGVPYSVNWRAPGEVIMLFIEPDLVHGDFPTFDLGVDVQPLAVLTQIEPRILDLCEYLRGFANAPNGESEFRVGGTGSALAAMIVEARGQLLRTTVGPLPQKSSEVVAILDRHLKETPHARLKLKPMAVAVGVSVRKFGRICHATVGKSPQQYLSKKKAEHAKRLIQQGVPIKEVYAAAGFADRQRMDRALRRQYGVKATEIRTCPR